ncbi:hypothetical protein [Photorhabdus caribbeanensis]|uniref:hypothetical protein n=1 Tax=Photorhabdus caribbeanensis TaxID=1004165 RepID=UPI001BD27328|nr:hypothetical protein [Photorhabdus caribbeanensis]MBS9426097.1 hypothetical protein [Photorhabdus caribbeanensis]
MPIEPIAVFGKCLLALFVEIVKIVKSAVDDIEAAIVESVGSRESYFRLGKTQLFSCNRFHTGNCSPVISY